MDRESWQATVHGVVKSQMRLSDYHSLTPLQIEKLTSCDWTRRLQVFLPKGSYRWGFPSGSNGKEPACNAGDLGSILEWGKSPGKGHDNPLQYSCLENPMDRGTWQATIHEAVKSRTQLSNTHTHTHTHTHNHNLGLPRWPSGKESAYQCRWHGFNPWEDPLEEAMVTHSSIFFLRDPLGQRSMAGYNPWVHKELDMTE